MRSLPLPNDDSAKFYAFCISKVRDPDLSARLLTVLPAVANAESAFRVGATNATLHTFIKENGVGGIVTTEEMTAVYTSRMAKRGTPGRPIYDRIMASAPRGRCPLCGQRDVSTLDHHLPKAHFPSLSVVIINLIPSCSDCNKAKLEDVPSTEVRQTLHPYFDNIDNDSWLIADIVETSPATAIFRVAAPAMWSAKLSGRMQYHFDIFGLGKLYASHAGDEISGLRDRLSKLDNSAGAVGVREHLKEEATSRIKVRVNSWQSALYKALSENAWFCSGGFKF